MGWYYSHHATKEELINELVSESVGPEWTRKVIAKSVRGSVLWTVNQMSNSTTGENRLFIGCDLLEKSGPWWGHKPMCEGDGPYYYSCPLKYLSMVPEQNAEWRRIVREHHARRTRRFSVGQQVELIGCTIPWVRITSANPLQGEYQGMRYRLNRGILGEIMQEPEQAPDGQNLAAYCKPMNDQPQPGI